MIMPNKLQVSRLFVIRIDIKNSQRMNSYNFNILLQSPLKNNVI